MGIMLFNIGIKFDGMVYRRQCSTSRRHVLIFSTYLERLGSRVVAEKLAYLILDLTSGFKIKISNFEIFVGFFVYVNFYRLFSSLTTRVLACAVRHEGYPESLEIWASYKTPNISFTTCTVKCTYSV